MVEAITQVVFVTKYALTRGVWTQRCIRSLSSSSTAIYWRSQERFAGYYREGKDVFLTEEEAREDVKKKAHARMVSLKKAMDKAEKLAREGYKTLVIEQKT